MDATGGDGGDSGIEAVAFVNPDDSVIVVMVMVTIIMLRRRMMRRIIRIMIMAMIVGSRLWHLSTLIIA